MNERLAVVIFNLGGPDRLEAVRPFLFNLFNDPNIITVRQPLRWLLARTISTLRAETSRELYRHIGGRSGLIDETQAQAAALQQELAPDGDAARVFVYMRYWHPMARDVVRQVKAYQPTRVVLLPLYPQFSTTTTGTSVAAFKAEAARQCLAVPIDHICCYPSENGFIDAMAALVRDAYQRETAAFAVPTHPGSGARTAPRVIFTAHSLPEKIIAAGDPYQWQVEKTAALIVARTEIPGLDWKLCYQSRLGPLKWIGPNIDAVIRRAGHHGLPVIVAPIAFVSEHVETLVELDRDMRRLAEEVGVPRFCRVPAVGTHPLYIRSLARLARAACGGAVCSGSGGRICLARFGKCPQTTASAGTGGS